MQFCYAKEHLAQPGIFGTAARTQAACWSRFREGVLASLKLKMELCPMADYTAPRAPEAGIGIV
jgi:hypothetical protein